MDFFEYRNGILHAESVALDRIADSVGTPCYVYSRAALERSWRAYRSGFGTRDVSIFYSVKSNSNLAVLALMAGLQSGFDIVSGGELQRVLCAGGRADKTVFSGVGKSADEIRSALEAGIFSLNIESQCEFERVHQIACEMQIQAPICIRVNPDVDAETHPHIATGLREAKFGVPFDEAKSLYRRASELENIKILGIAVHIGSQMTSVQPIVDALERVLSLVAELAEEGIKLGHLDLGGGLGVRYRDEEPPSIEAYCAAIAQTLDRHGAVISLSVEPGRAITADSGVLLSRVEYIKRGAQKNFAIIDAAMNDLIRPVLYNAWMDIVEVAEHSPCTPMLYDVVGPICESGDFLGKQRRLSIAAGQLVAVRGAGAYGAVMSSNYNTRPRTAEVWVDGSQFEVVRKRESIDQILELESMPDFGSNLKRRTGT